MSQHALAFADLALAPPVLSAIQQIGYEQPSPIQAQSIPHLLQGHDLLGTAQTGTGKTAAFALPLISQLNLDQMSPQALILVPTRELAIQVAQAFKAYGKELKDLRVLPIYGGQDMRGQLRQLKQGVHVLVATPGRLMDHLRRKSVKLDQLKTVVLDEADEMLRMGFIDDVTWILEHTPEQRQVALFSATMPKPIRQLANRYLKTPKEVAIQPKVSTLTSIQQRYWQVNGNDKLDALIRILEAEEFDGIITFVRTKSQTLELAEQITAQGYRCAAINGDMPQKARERTISQLKKGHIDILVATDVAARGIDVARISHVINYDIPYDTEAYIHRIGRTGRAGRSGQAILFVTPRERRLLRAIEKTTRQPIEKMAPPSHQQIVKKRLERFKQSITDAMEQNNLAPYRDLVTEYLEETGAEPMQLAIALTYLTQKDKPLLRETPSLEQEPHEFTTRQQGKKKRKNKGAKSDQELPEMELYRISVGRKHMVKPADIVGAIANEAQIDSDYIGRITLHDQHSTVELPSGMPQEVFRHLRKVYVRNQTLNIEKLAASSNGENSSRRASKPKPKKNRRSPRKSKSA